jgi:hypothetical protein
MGYAPGPMRAYPLVPPFEEGLRGFSAYTQRN